MNERSRELTAGGKIIFNKIIKQKHFNPFLLTKIMKTQNQQKVWDAIACEWHEFKKIPSELSKNFLKKCSGKVLDLGSGSGRHLTKIKKGKMYLVDFSREMLKLAEQKAKQKNIPAEFTQSDLSKLPFEDNFFDYCIFTHSLYCIPNKKLREKAVQELYRVMKPNAKILVSVWNKNSKRFIKKQKEIFVNWRNKGKRYYYLFEEKEIQDLFKKTGFKIIEDIKSEVNITFIAQKTNKS